MQITDYTVRKLVVPERPIGDSQTHGFGTEELAYAYLELETDTEHVGVGADVISFRQPGDISESVLRGMVEPIVGSVVGEKPLPALNRTTRHRGGEFNYYAASSYGAGPGRLLDYALWDLVGKEQGLPVYRLLGGSDPEIPVYASGLAFGRDDDATRALYEQFADRGVQAAKVKIGYPTVEEDIERIQLVREAFDVDPTIMADPNEAWSPKETIQRAKAFEDVGLNIYWIEDPVFREDLDGIARVVENVHSTHINMGDYCRFEEKQELLAADACDMLNLHGMTAARRGATLANAHGVPINLGTDHGTDVSAVHFGAALPEVNYVEFCFHRFYELAGEPFDIEDGMAIAPETPGHGVELDQSTLEEYAVS
jgi:L-alanine-DL-glutamate epimerase-like enolase superfamily enzyme